MISKTGGDGFNRNQSEEGGTEIEIEKKDRYV